MSNDSLLPTKLLSVAIALEGPGEVGETGGGERRGERGGERVREA